MAYFTRLAVLLIFNFFIMGRNTFKKDSRIPEVKDSSVFFISSTRPLESYV